MTQFLAPGTALAALDSALARLEADHLRFDEDLVGLALPEPLAGGAGLVVAVFPYVGGPGAPGTVYPARALVRATLGRETPMQIVHPVTLPGIDPTRPLGAAAPPRELTITERNSARRSWMTALDGAAPAVASGDPEPVLCRELRALWADLAWPVLRPSYRLFAPHFVGWLETRNPG